MAQAVRQHGTRQDTFVVRLTVNGEDYGIWDKKTGGELDSNELKYKPGGMRPTISLGGSTLPGNVTLSRLYDLKDDHDRINHLLNAAGSGTAVVSERPMDPDGNEYGKAIVYTGKLKRVTPPETDGEGNTAAMIEVEISVGGVPQAM